MLASAVKISYYCALRPSELQKLRIGDVIGEDNNILNQLERTSAKAEGRIQNIQVRDDARTVLAALVSNLEQNGYQIERNQPLLPSLRKDGSEYHIKKLRRDLEHYVIDMKEAKGGSPITWKDIKQGGICRFYENYSATLEDTAAFADLSKKQTLGILQGQITPAGKRRLADFGEVVRKIGILQNEDISSQTNLTNQQAQLLGCLLEEGLADNLDSKSIIRLRKLARQGISKVLDTEDKQALSLALSNKRIWRLNDQSVIRKLETQDKFDWHDLQWVAEHGIGDRLNLDLIARLKEAFFYAVDKKFHYGKDTEGDQINKEYIQRDIKTTFLKTLYEQNVGFDSRTGKAHLLTTRDPLIKKQDWVDLVELIRDWDEWIQDDKKMLDLDNLDEHRSKKGKE